jgi:hypothetical protein
MTSLQDAFGLRELIEARYREQEVEIPSWDQHQMDAFDSAAEMFDCGIWMLSEANIPLKDYEDV